MQQSEDIGSEQSQYFTALRVTLWVYSYEYN